eukprot:CAMPEP_0172496374 /NCGR_PEP_ID=MMETSP1066-20121228/86287_1 /TAXON_ID=671091 /ORGANISM="Coscinodiscus wailesii, Strain CCMP2513" /LENGTH=67 /DNA_ID=CAMNT_0013268647 /DNA_START=1 /DNA_END=201 /DNA_ORIENTATION=-
MKRFPENVTLQRHACLAVRNTVSLAQKTLMDVKTMLLELVVGGCLKQAGVKRGCVNKAYAALRDLGC